MTRPNDEGGSMYRGGAGILDTDATIQPEHMAAALEQADAYAARRELTDAQRAELRAMLGAA